MNYKGSCHCGKIKFEAEAEIGQLIECNCSHCSRKGFLLTFVPKDKFNLLTSEENLSTYLFNQKVITHFFCPVCGCAPFGYGKDEKGNEMAAINVRCLEDTDISAFERIQYDGKNF